MMPPSSKKLSTIATCGSFAGTALFISHDRYFLDRMADRIVEVRGGGVQSHAGGYSDWLETVRPP